MAISMKQLLAQSMLKLCKTIPLTSITIKHLLTDTGMSRQTFYNHFKDKQDLIQYIYEEFIIPDFTIQTPTNLNFYQSLQITLQNIQTYHYFMKQACQIQGQNNLTSYIYQHCESFDMQWHQTLYGKQPMPETLQFAIKYHANASTNMTLSWILSDMPVSCEELANLIVRMRSLGMDVLLKTNPYQSRHN